MIFFSNFDCQRAFPYEGLSAKKTWGTKLISEKAEVLSVEPNETAEEATSVYSATDDFLQCIYSVLVAKIIRSSNQGVWLTIFCFRH